MNSGALDILLCEDNEDDIVLLQETLEAEGLVNIVEVVRDGEQAMAYLRREGVYGGSKRPGLVLLDINMPRKNGLEVLEEVKSDPSLKRLPIVMLTVSDREEDVARAYSSGASSYIRKPVTFRDFQKAIAQFAVYWGLVSTVPKWGT